MDATLVTDLLKEDIVKYGTPQIVNTDQGNQYTRNQEKQLLKLKQHSIKISMNGKARPIDNIAIERFFRTLKYDEIYINDYPCVKELHAGVALYMTFFNFN